MDAIRTAGRPPKLAIRDTDSFAKLVIRLACAGLLFLSLSIIYTDYVSVLFAYYGFQYIFEPARLPLAIGAILVLTAFVAPRIGDVNALLVTLCHFFFLIPTAVMFVYGGLYSSIFLWTVVILLALIGLSRTDISINFRASISLTALELCLFALALAGLALAISSVGLFSLSFNIFEVYDQRALANEADLGIFGYIQQLGVQASLLLIAVAFFNRQYAMAVGGFAIAILFFAYTGHKSFLFWSLFLVAFIYLGRLKNKFSIFVISATVFTWIMVLIMDTSIGSDLNSFLTRRTLFTPVLLNQYYIMFADQFGFLSWSYSKVGLGFFEYTDTVSPTQAVGHYLTGSDTNSANTGMIGFGFINAGHFGVAAYLITFFGIMLLGGGVAKAKGIELLGAAIMIRAAYSAVTTSDLPAIFLSGGLGYALILLLVYPSVTATAPSKKGTLAATPDNRLPIRSPA